MFAPLTWATNKGSFVVVYEQPARLTTSVSNSSATLAGTIEGAGLKCIRLYMEMNPLLLSFLGKDAAPSRAVHVAERLRARGSGAPAGPWYALTRETHGGADQQRAQE